ncbi:alpha/beta fold hydrolase [Deinococcus sp. QL22]|uniref:alpha/beta fold hydrolase n=1 Tax=Deinococcus sp. QL22 TaxID=2939437 RepID=UPI002016BB4B|nr:alpha/beta fold hydrolase [Deinococcus sp. QL22]UQN08342.1 alpha/beta fold hydrolase [Deinococcus sp. QL22]
MRNDEGEGGEGEPLGGREAFGAVLPRSVQPDSVQSGVLECAALVAGTPVSVRLGWQAWGQLNAAHDNAVLVCHYYTGTMRAAGCSPDGTPGWWSALIGPGKAVDTDQFFVVCMNTLSNVQTHEDAVITTGPDTLHPDGTPWGERFPAWEFADLHALQLNLMHALAVPRWHAVIGPSFGGMQALQWAARTPELAVRVAAVAASPQSGVTLRGVFGPLMREVTPTGGIDAALRLISFFGLGADGLHHLFGHTDFDAYLRSRAQTASLPHILDIARVVQTHRMPGQAQDLFARWQESGLRLLTVNISGDQFFPAAEMRTFAGASHIAGVAHQHLEYASACGHLGCVQDTLPFAAALRDLLHDQASGLAPAHSALADRGQESVAELLTKRWTDLDSAL